MDKIRAKMNKEATCIKLNQLLLYSTYIDGHKEAGKVDWLTFWALERFPTTSCASAVPLVHLKRWWDHMQYRYQRLPPVARHWLWKRCMEELEKWNGLDLDTKDPPHEAKEEEKKADGPTSDSFPLGKVIAVEGCDTIKGGKSVHINGHHLAVLSFFAPGKYSRLSVHVTRPIRAGDLVFTEYSDLTGSDTTECTKQLLQRSWRSLLWPRDDIPIDYSDIDPQRLASGASFCAHLSSRPERISEPVVTTSEYLQTTSRIENNRSSGHGTDPICIFPFAALMAPRSYPNIFRVIEQRQGRARLRIFALRDINDGDEIGYRLDPSVPFSGFTCECVLCHPTLHTLSTRSIHGTIPLSETATESSLSPAHQDIGIVFRSPWHQNAFQIMLQYCYERMEPRSLYTRNTLSALADFVKSLAATQILSKS